MQLINVQFKNNLCQLISIENDFSLKSSIKCWLPALTLLAKEWILSLI